MERGAADVESDWASEAFGRELHRRSDKRDTDDNPGPDPGEHANHPATPCIGELKHELRLRGPATNPSTPSVSKSSS